MKDARSSTSSSSSSTSSSTSTGSDVATKAKPQGSTSRPEKSSASTSKTTGKEKLPPLTPPRIKKIQLVPDPNIFSKLDYYVKKTPNSEMNSLEELASYLMARCGSDLEKVRALYCWAAYNIAYDSKSYFSGSRKAQDARSVLQTGKAVCEGYSQLFHALCRIANVPCLQVSGIAKGFGHDPEDVYTADSKTNHAWNLVLLKGEWHPLDSTWGAGHLDKGGNFTRKFEEHWFLTDPEEFLPRHFPLENGNVAESMKYQLVEKPITIEHFSATVAPEEYAYVIGLKCLTHSRTVIEVYGDVTIKVKATRYRLTSASVTLEERVSGKKTRVEESGVLLSQAEDGTCSIYVRPPRVATYILEIYGSTSLEDNAEESLEDSEEMKLLVTYAIKCKKTHSNTEPLPSKSDMWGLLQPRAAEYGLKQAQDMSFIFEAEDSEVQVPLLLKSFKTLSANLVHAYSKNKLKEYTFIEYTNTGAIVRARLPEAGYYTLEVFVGHANESSLKHVGDFLLFTDEECDDCLPFPHVYPFAQEHGVHLLEPLIGQLQAGTTTRFRLRAPTFTKVKVGDKQMEMRNNNVWEATVVVPRGEKSLSVYGAQDDNAKTLGGLFKFSVV